MIKLLTINKTAWIGFFIALIALFVMAVTTHAQETPEDAARKYNVSFPIAELGGCSDYSACRSFCEDPLNATACIDYGKQKGFYKEESFEVNNKILETAKGQLGCDSKTSCLNFCEVPANHDKCEAFAKGQGLVGGRVDDPSKTQVISRAREVLGCNSATGCQSLCSKEENRQKCSEFAKTVGLHGGETKVGPGGCTSEGTCKSFCSDPANFQVCHGFTSVAGGKFTGPGGCDSETSCRAYCQSNEQACSKVFGGPGTGGGIIQTKYDPVDMCNRTPNCAWTGNNCQCGFYGETRESAQRGGEYASYCQANPDKCRPGQPGGFTDTQEREEFERYCRQNPDRCRQTGPGGGPASPPPYVGDPAAECARYGCTWSNNSCQCGGIKDYDPKEQCNRAPNCSWTGSSCQCSYTYQSPGGYTYQSPSGSCPAGQYMGPGGYCIPASYGSPDGYTYQSPGGYTYQSPGGYTYQSPGGYTYQSPGGYTYQSPGGYTYQSPGGYTYQSPGGYTYQSPSYGSPSYGSPSYGSPSYGSPSYGSPSYGTPEQPSYGSPSYGSPSYGSPVQGVSTQRGLFEQLWDFLTK